MTSEELDARLRAIDAGLREVRALLEQGTRDSRERWERIEAETKRQEQAQDTRRKTK